MNWKRGFRRLTWTVSVLGSVLFFAISLLFTPSQEGETVVLIAVFWFVGVWLTYFAAHWVLRGLYSNEKCLQRKPINWKRGFRRVTLCCATLGAVTGGILANVVAINAIQAKVDKARIQNLDFSILRNKVENEWTTVYETEIKQQPNRPHDIAKAEKNFWLRLSPQNIICLAILTGLVVSAFVFCAIWFLYYVFRWLTLGFAEDKPKDEPNNK